MSFSLFNYIKYQEDALKNKYLPQIKQFFSNGITILTENDLQTLNDNLKDNVRPIISKLAQIIKDSEDNADEINNKMEINIFDIIIEEYLNQLSINNQKISSNKFINIVINRIGCENDISNNFKFKLALKPLFDLLEKLTVLNNSKYYENLPKQVGIEVKREVDAFLNASLKMIVIDEAKQISSLAQLDREIAQVNSSDSDHETFSEFQQSPIQLNQKVTSNYQNIRNTSQKTVADFTAKYCMNNQKRKNLANKSKLAKYANLGMSAIFAVSTALMGMMTVLSLLTLSLPATAVFGVGTLVCAYLNSKFTNGYLKSDMNVTKHESHITPSI